MNKTNIICMQNDLDNQIKTAALWRKYDLTEPEFFGAENATRANWRITSNSLIRDLSWRIFTRSKF